MPTVTQVNDLKINKLTKAQYDEAVQSGVIGENEISIITDLDAGQIIQVDVLPTAGATEEGKIYQYIGETKRIIDATITDCNIEPFPTIEFNVQALEAAIGTTLPNSGTMTLVMATSETGSRGVEIEVNGTVYEPSGWYSTKEEALIQNGIITSEIFNFAEMEYTTEEFTNGYFYKCVSDGQSPATYSWENIEVQPAGDSLPDQTGQSGKFLTTDGTDASWAGNVVTDTGNKTISSGCYAILGGTATGQYGSIGIAGNAAGTECLAVNCNITSGGTRSVGIAGNISGAESVAVGRYSNTSAGQSIVVGKEAKIDRSGSNYSIAIGYMAKVGDGVDTKGAIQLGKGTNNNSGTMKVCLTTDGTNFNNYELLSTDGTIPEARLADTTSATQGQVLQLDSNNNAVWKNIISTPSTTPTLLSNSWTENPTTHEITQTVSIVGVTLTNLVMVGPTPVSAEDYNDSNVICIAQGVDTLTFKCTTIPSVDLTLNVLCF